MGDHLIHKQSDRSRGLVDLQRWSVREVLQYKYACAYLHIHLLYLCMSIRSYYMLHTCVHSYLHTHLQMYRTAMIYLKYCCHVVKQQQTNKIYIETQIDIYALMHLLQSTYIYSKTFLTDHIHRSTISLYRSLYSGPNRSPIQIF